MTDPLDVPAAVTELARELSKPQPMRRGTLSVPYIKCNKPGCPCADRADARHGPYYSVVRVVAGKTRSHHVSATHAGLLEAQIQAGQQFRRRVEAYWRACEQWADARLDDPAATSEEGAKKGASKRPSRRRSSGRSKRS
jgi:hypothetical protein